MSRYIDKHDLSANHTPISDVAGCSVAVNHETLRLDDLNEAAKCAD